MDKLNNNSHRDERYCPICNKRETRNECSYGGKVWDKVSIKDEEYSMVRSELENIITASKKLKTIVGKGEGNLEAWVQSKITKASDYIDTAADYLESNKKLNESNLNKKEVSLVEKILIEENCRKIGNNKISNILEERDPKGPTQPYKNPEEIAKLHGVSLASINKQLKIGIKVEYEHTSDKSKARITALQHLEEIPNYYSKLKKMETQKESITIEDANGNSYIEFIDLIKSGTIEEENPGLWANIRKRREKGLPKKKPGQKGYPKTLDIEEGIEQARKNVGASKCWKGKKLGNPPTKIKNGKEVPNCVDEAVRIPAQTGNNMFVTLSWRGKYYTIQLFFPQSKIPTRNEISDEIQKIYPNSKVIAYRIAEFKPGEPIIMGGSGGKLGTNRNYVKTMGEDCLLGK